MTPAYRKKLGREIAIGLLLALVGLCAGLYGSNSLLSALGVIATIGYFIVVALRIAISRCPRCVCPVDLQTGGFHCPKCGVWLPPAPKRSSGGR